MLFAFGAAFRRSRLLPRWLAWVTIVFGVISLTGWVSLFFIALWSLVVSVLIHTRESGAREPSESPAAAGVPATVG